MHIHLSTIAGVGGSYVGTRIMASNRKERHITRGLFSGYLQKVVPRLLSRMMFLQDFEYVKIQYLRTSYESFEICRIVEERKTDRLHF